MHLRSWHIALFGSALQLIVIIYMIIKYHVGFSDSFIFFTVPLFGTLFAKLLHHRRTRNLGALLGAVPSAGFFVIFLKHAQDIVVMVPLAPALIAAGVYYFWKEKNMPFEDSTSFRQPPLEGAASVHQIPETPRTLIAF